MAALCISNATSPHGFLIPPHRYLRDRQSEEQCAGGCLLPHGNACPREQGDGALANGTAAFRGGRRSRDSSESGTLLGVGPGLCRTSENSVKAKFGTTPVQQARIGGYRTGTMQYRASGLPSSPRRRTSQNTPSTHSGE